MIPVTDPNLISQLEQGGSPQGSPVTDPALIAQLESGGNQPASQGYFAKFGSDAMADIRRPAQIAQDVYAGVGNGLGGIARSGQMINTGMVNGINNMFGTHLPVDNSQYLNQFHGPTNPTETDKQIQNVSSFLPYAFGGEAALPEKLFGSGLMGTVAKAGATSSAYGAANSADPLQGAIKGGITGIASVVPGLALSKGLGALSNNLTSEQLAQNVAAAQGTNTPLGNVIGSPTLQAIQTGAMNVPLGNRINGQWLQNTIGDQVKSQGQNILQNLSGGIAPEDVGATLQQALKNQLSDLQTMKSANYKTVNNIADKIGLNVGSDSAQSAAKNALESINRDPRLKSTLDNGFIQDVKTAAQDSPVNITADAISGTKVAQQPITLKDANIYKSTLGDKANSAYTDGNLYQYGIYKSLKDAVGNDINNAITNSGSPELQAAHNTAQEFYANNIAPWEDPNIAKFARGNADADTLISSFVKPGQTNDRGNLIGSLINKLPQEQQSLPGYAYLSRASNQDPLTGEVSVDPLKFSKLYNNIGSNTKDALFGSNQTRQQLENYNRLISMNSNMLNANPTKGQAVTGGLEALGGLGAGFVGGHMVAPGVALGAAAGLSGGANIANRLLTSPNFRNYVINKMQNQQPYQPYLINRLTGGLGATPAIINNNQGQ